MNAITKQIFDHILDKIEEGFYKTGDKLPPEVRLAEKFNTNRMNAHFAMKNLESADIVERNKRGGTIVKGFSGIKHIEKLKQTSSDTVYILASPPERRFNIQWNESMVNELEKYLSEKGLKVFYKFMPHDAKNFRHCIKEISCPSKAVVFFPDRGGTKLIIDNLDSLEEIKGDIFLLDRGSMNLSDFPYHVVGKNLYEEGMTAGKYILNKGVRKIIFVSQLGYGKRFYWAQRRYDGLCNALKGFADVECRMEVESEEIPDWAPWLFPSYCGQDEKPLFVAGNDEVAAALIDAAKKTSMKPPEDFYVMGFENVAGYRNYNITTVLSEIHKAGSILGKIIFSPPAWLEDNTKIRVELSSQVIERSTF